MAIAHVCLGCGFDLARIRARQEPHYGLPVVTCPTCNRTAVYRRHPMWRGWKTLLRVDWALTIMCVQIFMIGLLATLTTIVTMFVIITIPRIAGGDIPAEAFDVALWTCCILAPITGAWLTAGFNHLSRIRVWIGWYAFLLMIFVAIGVGFIAAGEIPREISHSGHHVPFQTASANSRLQVTAMLFLFPAGWILFVFMMVALVGIPFGHIGLRLATSVRRARWRWRRRRRKMLRVAV